jgi:hypothetical protein
MEAERCWARKLQTTSHVLRLATRNRRPTLTAPSLRQQSGRSLDARTPITSSKIRGTLGSTSSIDLEDGELVNASLPLGEQRNAGSASVTLRTTSETSDDPGDHALSDNGAGTSSTRAATAQAVAWKLPFPLIGRKQKRPLQEAQGPPAYPSAAMLAEEARSSPAVQPGQHTGHVEPARKHLRRSKQGWGPLGWLLYRLQGRHDLDSRADYVKIDFRAHPKQLINPFQPSSWPKLEVDVGTFWGLLVLSLAYVHHSTTG